MNTVLLVFLAASAATAYKRYDMDHHWTHRYIGRYCIKPTPSEFRDPHSDWNTGLAHRPGDNPWGPK